MCDKVCRIKNCSEITDINAYDNCKRCPINDEYMCNLDKLHKNNNYTCVESTCKDATCEEVGSLKSIITECSKCDASYRCNKNTSSDIIKNYKTRINNIDEVSSYEYNKLICPATTTPQKQIKTNNTTDSQMSSPPDSQMSSPRESMYNK